MQLMLASVLVLTLAVDRPVLATDSPASFCATLNGNYSGTDSSASGTAHIVIDTETDLVDVSINVSGIDLDGLSTVLRDLPVGPIHLHQYPAHHHSTDAQVILAMPVPYGSHYQPTPSGFRVELRGYSYSDGAELLGSELSAEDFLAAIEGGDVILNIHTNHFPDGAISGVVQRACAAGPTY